MRYQIREEASVFNAELDGLHQTVVSVILATTWLMMVLANVSGYTNA